MIDKLLTIAGQFELEGTIAEIKPLGEGFINDTYVVKTEGDAPDYILQRKNHLIFPDVPGMMDNIQAVTTHIKTKIADPMRETLTVIPAKDGKLYTAFHIHTNYDAPSGDRRACITEVYFDEKGEFKIKP